MDEHEYRQRVVDALERIAAALEGGTAQSASLDDSGGTPRPPNP